MEDTITIKIKETTYGQDKWYEYNLSYEEFAYIQPILKTNKTRKECPVFDANDPGTALNTISSLFMPFNNNNNKRGIIYNIKEKPSDKTLEEVMDFYKKENVLLIESDKTETKQMLY